jgi:hypothetical protein
MKMQGKYLLNKITLTCLTSFHLKAKKIFFFFKILPLTIVQIDIKYTCQIISFFQDLSIKVKQPLYY